VAGTLDTNERALGHTLLGRSLARGDRLHLVASAAHGWPATVDGGSHPRASLALRALAPPATRSALAPGSEAYVVRASQRRVWTPWYGL
jgi:hypothetical protein